MNYTHEIIFISSFVLLLISSYLIGLGDKNKDQPLKDGASSIMGISVATMIIVWAAKWRTNLPGNTRDFLFVWDAIKK